MGKIVTVDFVHRGVPVILFSTFYVTLNRDGIVISLGVGSDDRCCSEHRVPFQFLTFHIKNSNSIQVLPYELYILSKVTLKDDVSKQGITVQYYCLFFNCGIHSWGE